VLDRNVSEDLTAAQQGASTPEALHAAAAGLTQEALDYWEQAGQLAVLRSAYDEAIAHFGAAIGLWAGLDDATTSKKREAQLQLQRGHSGAFLPRSWDH
jgi:predicted ATPase